MTGGLSFGSVTGGDVTAVGVTPTASNTVSEILTLTSAGDDHQIVFDTTTSTFNRLASQADNGVVVKADVTTDVGGLYLDGDSENSSSQDGLNTVGLTDGRTLSAETVLTLESSTGSIVNAGLVTLSAGTGVTILDDMLGAANNKAVVIFADYESAGDGTLTVWTGKTITSNKSL